MADKVVAGTTKTLEAFLERDGVRLDADAIFVTVWDPSEIAVVTSAPPTRHPTTGHYQYDYGVPSAAPRGNYRYSWLSVVGDEEIPPDEDYFTVIGPGDLGDGSGRICTVEEVQSYCRETFDTAASVVCGMMIDGAQATLEDWLGRPVTVRSFTEDRVLPTFTDLPDRRLYLRNTPVASIDVITLDGTPVTTASYTAQRFGLSDVSFAGTNLHVQYTAGLDGTARDFADLKFCVLRAVKREMGHYRAGDFGLTEISEPGFSAKFVDPEMVFTPGELRSVMRRKRRRAR